MTAVWREMEDSDEADDDIFDSLATMVVQGKMPGFSPLNRRAEETTGRRTRRRAPNAEFRGGVSEVLETLLW